MARTTQRTYGTFAGTIGSLTNYVGNDQHIPEPTTLNITYKPITLRTAKLEKIKICNQFINTFAGTGFFDRSFPALDNSGDGYNRVSSILVNQAVKGSYQNMYLSYPQVMISKGKLPGALHAAAAPMKNGNLYFHFIDNSETGSAASSDKIILVAYVEKLQQVIFSLHAGLRKNCEAILKTAAFKGHHVETWMGFLSNDECSASNSVYTGRHLLIK